MIGKFTGIWSSPKAMAIWVDKKWKPLIKGHLSHAFYRGFFGVFLFE
jgi:hypothetical protein